MLKEKNRTIQSLEGIREQSDKSRSDAGVSMFVMIVALILGFITDHILFYVASIIFGLGLILDITHKRYWNTKEYSTRMFLALQKNQGCKNGKRK